jgi:hypothetical protein
VGGGHQWDHKCQQGDASKVEHAPELSAQRQHPQAAAVEQRHKQEDTPVDPQVLQEVKATQKACMWVASAQMNGSVIGRKGCVQAAAVEQRHQQQHTPIDPQILQEIVSDNTEDDTEDVHVQGYVGARSRTKKWFAWCMVEE